MDDGLAERLFIAFWNGDPRAAELWRTLSPARREAWELVAIAARAEFAAKVDAKIEMLRSANDGWQRVHAELQAELDALRLQR